jgi:transposase
MKTFNRVHFLTAEERAALVKGTKAKAGFTVRRSHSLLLSAEGYSPQHIARRLHGGDQTVRHVLRAFEREGGGCWREKSHRPHPDQRVFTPETLAQLEALVHRSPRDLGQPTSLWTLPLLAQVCFQQGRVARPIRDETVRRALIQLGIDWQPARQRLPSQDPHDEIKKPAAPLDRLG